MGKFISEKLFDGYSTCFRQWRADGTHCKFIHGYAISFRVWFEGDLDERNWVFDFGGMKRAKTKIKISETEELEPAQFFSWLLDHTTIIAQDDPYLEKFIQMEKDGIIQLRILSSVGCERFAQILFDIIQEFLFKETNGRVKVSKVTVYENNKNSATYKL